MTELPWQIEEMAFGKAFALKETAFLPIYINGDIIPAWMRTKNLKLSQKCGSFFDTVNDP